MLDGLRMGSNFPCLAAFGFLDFGSRVGNWMDFSRIRFCPRVQRSVSFPLACIS